MDDIIPTEADETEASNSRAARRTAMPSDHVLVTIDFVCRWFDKYVGKLGKDGAWFRNAYTDALETPEEPYDADYFIVKTSRGGLGKNLMPFQITGIIACCVEARIAETAGDERVAWTYAADARHIAVDMMHMWGNSFDGRAFLARRGALARLAKNPIQAAKHAAMQDVEEEFKRWQEHPVRYANDAAFAKAMHTRHAKVLENEGSIKNACTRWRRNQESSC